MSGRHSDTSSSDPRTARSCEDTPEAGSEAAKAGREPRLEEGRVSWPTLEPPEPSAGRGTLYPVIPENEKLL